jgi:benzoyl-CoA reductase/2-hydroxyglutaryl-CoA dehydratase subunit BcrC/BadD/HgdB
MASHGAALTLNAGDMDGRALRKAVAGFAGESGLPATEWIIFECSGTAAGQTTAFGLLTHGATLCVVGFTMARVELRLSNLMAFHARALGNWGCPPELYPAALDLVLDSHVALAPFVERYPLDGMLHVPYEGDGVMTDNMRDYVVKQLKEVVIPTFERVSGVKFDIDRLREYLRESARAEDDFVWVLQSAKNKPSPIDSFFGGVYYIGPIFTVFRGTPEATEYYALLRGEIEQRIREGKGPITPEGKLSSERYRLVVEGTPNWTSFREFWKMFYDEGAVVVANTYTKIAGVYDFGFRHDPDRPLESIAECLLGVYTNRNMTSRAAMLENYMDEYQADGLLVNSIKSCNSFSAGQLLLMREIERRTGKPAGFIETNRVDPRYFSAANVKNRLESYFQMIEQKRRGGAAAA